MIQVIMKLFGLGTKVDYDELVKQGAVILDVRNEDEFNMGHIKGAVNIPLHSFNDNLVTLTEKDTPIVIYCVRGVRSAVAKKFLLSKGFLQVYDAGNIDKLIHRL